MSEPIEPSKDEQQHSFNSGIIRKTEYFDLFISYKRDNGEDHGQVLAEELYDKLTKDGYKVWLDNQEIGYSSDFEKRIEEAIIHSKKFVTVLGPGWVKSPNCRYEFQTAVGFEKRIIPIYYQDFRKLLEDKKDEGVLTEHEWRRIDKPQEVNFGDPKNFAKSYKALTALCDLKDDITTQHTKILCESFYWEKYKRPKSMLFDGAELSKVKLLKSKCDSDSESPSFNPLQNEFLKESEKFVTTEVSNKRKVYVSFQPDELGFAAELNMELKLHNISTWFDDESSATSEGESSFIQPILNCENVLDVVTNGNTKEDDLRIAFARSNNKRIVQITNSKAVLSEHKEKGEKNIFFWDENVSIDSLITTINGDRVYNAAHAKLLSEAYEWEKSEKNNGKLLPFREAQAKQEWYQNAEKLGAEPKPNLDMINFVERSLSHAETVRKRKRLTLWSTIVGIAILVALGVTSFILKDQVAKADAIAEKANETAKLAEDRVETAKIAERIAEENAKINLQKAADAELLAAKAEDKAAKAKDREDAAIIKEKAADIKAQIATVKAEAAQDSLEIAEEAMKEANALAEVAKSDAKKAKEDLEVINKKTNASKLSLEAFDLTLDGEYSKAQEKADSAVAIYEEIEGGDYETDLLYNTYYSILSKTAEDSLNPEEIDFTRDSSVAANTVNLDHCQYALEPNFKWNTVKSIGLKGLDTTLVYTLAYSEDRKFGALGTKSGKVYLFNPESNKITDTVSIGMYRVTSMGFNEDATQLVASTVNQKFAIIPLVNSSGKRDYSKQILRRESFARVEEIEYLDENTIRAFGGVIDVDGEERKEYKLYPATVKKITEILD